MSNPSSLGAVCYEAESNWAEDVVTFATHRLPIISPVDASGLEQQKLDPQRVQQYRSGGSQWILGILGGTFKTKMWLAGHGSSTAGTPSLTADETFLGIPFGNVALSLATSQTMTGGTAAIPTMSGATGVVAGGAVFNGALGDGDGDGQLYAVATHSGSNLNLIGAMNGAPVNGAVVFPSAMLYPGTSPTSGVAITGTRFLLQTANLEYECHGCFPISYEITGLNTAELPAIEITWQVSWWRYSTATFPSTVATTTFNPAANAAGSFNVQVVGTTTRNARPARNVSLQCTIGVQPLMGPGGVNAYQAIVGARRVDDSFVWSWTEDADAATTSPVLPGYGTGTSSYHIEWTGSTTPGSRVGIKSPKVCITNVATQQLSDNLNRLTITGQAYQGDTLTSDLTRAPIVVCLG